MKADQTGGEHQDKKGIIFFLEKLEKQVSMKLKSEKLHKPVYKRRKTPGKMSELV